MLTSPSIVFMSDGIKAQPMYNLPHMTQTDSFKGQAIPIVLLRGSQCITPKMLVCNAMRTKFVMKQREEVYQLINSIFLKGAIVISPYEVTMLQIVQHFT